MREEAYLESVIEVLHDKIARIDEKMAGNEKDIENMHQYFWENYNEFDEYGYELFDNTNAVKARLKEQGDYVKERCRYEKMLYSPYFGRVDFCYEGEDTPEVYYIGIANLARGRADNPYVFDWRAPVSGLFYDYDQGEAQFQAPAGMIKGEITKKKQYKIKNGRLVYVLENEMNIDDEILQQALCEHADAKLKNIVTTIQREQNSIVRDKAHRILAVQGCAGSGKTSVALHRIAYLLYHNRGSLNAAQVLILSPNNIFADYISRILPELGEENICEMTFDDFAYRKLRRYGEAEDRYDELEKSLHKEMPEEYFLEKNLIPSTGEADYKQTKEYIEELNGFVLALEWEIVNFSDFQYKKSEMKEEEIAKYFYEKMADVPILSRMKKIGEYFIDDFETLKGKDLDQEEREEILQGFDAMYETKNLAELYNRFLEESGREPLDREKKILRYEDVYPMIYLDYALFEQKPGREVKHLIIDEMQDYTYLQYVLLEKMFHCPMTILGDKVQTMAGTYQDVLKFLPKIFGRDVHILELSKSYRSTTEITSFANKLVGEEDTWSVARHGEEPLTLSFSDRDEMFVKLAEDLAGSGEFDTLSVLCLDADRAKEAYDRLKKEDLKLDLYLLTKDSMKFNRGISVMPFYLAKGLEFDGVFVPDVQDYVTPLHRQALYINSTRALHVLRLYGVEP
ncbi:MAG: AAA family ATPase [Lachnospiraceae bacterium]|nr:AAA family ATPase [Lachnospiraceae bacterium]MDE6982548.1 AAA family ATPase [Lachnospiraceae bacterium]